MTTTTKEQRACEWDKVLFTPERSTARFCSSACRVAAHRAAAKGAPSVTHDGNATSPSAGPAPVRVDGYQHEWVVKLFLTWMDRDRSTPAGKRQWTKALQECETDLRMYLNDLLDLGARVGPMQTKADAFDSTKQELDEARDTIAELRGSLDAAHDILKRVSAARDSLQQASKQQTGGLSVEEWESLAALED